MRAERVLHRVSLGTERRWAHREGDRWLGVSDVGWLNGGDAELTELQGDWAEVPVFGSGTVFAFAETYAPDGESRSLEWPLVFIKPSHCVIPESEPVPIGDLVDRGAKVWGEGEIALLMGSDGPMGVTLANDVTMELGAEHDHHLPYYKGQPGFCPVASMLLPLSVLEGHVLECWQGEEAIAEDAWPLRRGTDANLARGFVDLLDWLRAWWPVAEGDLVLFGAPRRLHVQGDPTSRQPRPFAKPGTRYRARLNGTWTLDTTFG